MSVVDWHSIAAGKRAVRDSLIPQEWWLPEGSVPDDVLDVLDVPAKCGILTPAQVAITETDAVLLVEQMVSKELKSYDVTLAFCKRAAIAQQLTNCLTEIFFEAGLAAARAIDEDYARTGVPLGPLHGLPVSLKDNMNIAGYDSTCGLVGQCNKPMPFDSETTKIMKECGAVLYCKTNIPGLMMYGESYNNVWGYNSNPANRNLTSGGSSGGEAALLALKGSPLGVGTDVGGSIRIPAGFCGLYSLKPSAGRFPVWGIKPGLAGQDSIKSANGPMSSSMGAVELWAKAVVGKEPWKRDPSVLPIPWREIELPSKLSFGIIMDDGVHRPTPPVKRALLETRAALEAQGHTVVEWSPYNIQECIDLTWDFFFVADGGITAAEAFEQSGEPWPLPGLDYIKAAYDKTLAGHQSTVANLWKKQVLRNNYIKGAFDHWMDSKKISGTGRPFDAVISPIAHLGGVPRYTYKYLQYTFIWNLLDQPGVTVPVTRATMEDTLNEPFENPRNEEEERLNLSYDPKIYLGAPVSLQIIGARLEDEKTLKVAGVVAEALSKSK